MFACLLDCLFAATVVVFEEMIMESDVAVAVVVAAVVAVTVVASPTLIATEAN